MSESKPSCYAEPGLVERCLERGVPLPPGLGRLLYVINRYAQDKPLQPVRPANIQIYSTPEK